MHDVSSLNVATADSVEVAPGIKRINLIETPSASGWMIEFGPGTRWPEVDVHVGEERYFVVSGELIDGDHTYPAGSYVVLADGSAHQPWTVGGATILGINLPRAVEPTR